MNEFQLSCFLAVAECLNFARAAEQLHVTQPAVTQQIHSLEKELNVRLFKRTTRTVKLTEAGFLFLEDAQRIVALANRARARFDSPYGLEEVRTLAIGCYSYAQLFLLSPVLRELAKRYPDLHPRLRVVPFQHLYRLLEEDDVDAVIAFREPDSKKITTAYREIITVPMVCVCPADSHLARRESVILEDLREEKLVLFDPARAQADAARLQGRLMEGRRFSDFYFSDSAEGVVIFVESGLGVAILPDLCIPPDHSLARVPIQGAEPVSYGIYFKPGQQSAPLRDLIQLLRETMESASASTALPERG